MDTKFLVASVLILLIVGATMFFIMTYMARGKKLSEKQKLYKIRKRWQFYTTFPLSRRQFRRIHDQIASLAIYTYSEIQVQAVKLYERAMLMSLGLFLIGFVLLGDIMSGIVLLLFAYVMMNTTINKRIDDINYQTLHSISRLILSIRECYTRSRSVPDAVNDAKVDKILIRSVDKIYNICTAVNADDLLEEFYHECPNRTLRTLATTCYIRSDTGEDSATGKSQFKQALSLIKDEVDMEIRRQLNQRLMFGRLDRLPFYPLALYAPVKLFYVNMLSATASVFNSSIGYVIKLAIIVASFVSYYILSTINNNSIANTDDRSQIIVRLLQHTPVTRFADSLITWKFRKQKKLEEELNGCLSSKTLRYMYLEKFILACILTVVSVIFSILILMGARSSTRTSLTPSTMSVQLTYTSEEEIAVLKYDTSVLASDSLPTRTEMFDVFTGIFPRATETEVDAQVDRLIDKFNTYKALHFYWWFAFVYIGCAIIGWFIPNALLKLRSKVVESEVELDVMQLQTVISILMDTPLDNLSVLYWLMKSSVIHKDVLSFCYHEYVRDPERALDHLQSKVSSNDFKAIVDKLKTTISQVTLAEAFEDLVSERQNQMQMREAVQMSALKSKRNLAGPVATFPMVVWMFADFLLPLGIVAVRSATVMLEQLNQM